MNADGTKQDRLVDLVRKLLALAANSAATPEEAANAAARAGAIVEKYNLDRARIERPEQAYTVLVYRIENRANWRRLLLCAVAEAHFCSGSYKPSQHWFSAASSGEEWRIVGESHNLEVVAFLYAHLVREVDRLTEEAWEARPAGGPWTTPRSWKNSFRHGCVQTVAAALRQRSTAFRRQSEQSAALVLVKSAALDRAVADLVGKVHEDRRRVEVGDRDGLHRGREAGGGIRIQDAVRSTASPTQHALRAGR